MKALDLMTFFELDVVGIIHVGANSGQEREAYRRAGADACLYIEPVSSVFQVLQQNLVGYPGHVAIKAACSDVGGETVELNIANNDGESSSIFPLGEHKNLFPSVKYVASESVVTRTLEEIVETEASGTKFNLIVIDTQGAELKVLNGAKSMLPHVDGIFVEVSEIPLYEGGCTVDEITAFLHGFGFHMKWMEIGRYRYGDAFYLRDGHWTPPPSRAVNKALGKPASQSSLSIWSRPDDAQGGNNGERTGAFGFHTDIEPRPWWQVDLERMGPIQEIRVFNRVDVCSERARTMTISVSADGQRWEQIHDQSGRRFGGIDGRPLRVFPRRMEAQFVRFQLQETQYFHLDEVEIY
jgi:FkbM family methyltransferase